MGLAEAQLVSEILNHDGIQPERLAKRFEVSVRTLRKYVGSANDAISGLGEIVLKRGQGYHVETDDLVRLKDWVRRESLPSSSSIPSTTDERTRWLTDNLLLMNEWVTLDELSEKLYVSRTSITSDLKQVESALARYGLQIDRRPNRGIRVIGGEQARRLCLAHGIFDKMGGAIPLALDGEDETGSFEYLLRVSSDCIRHATAQSGYQVNTAAYNNLVVHVAVGIMRMMRGAFATMERDLLETIRDSNEYPLAQNMAREIGERLSLELPPAEIAVLAVHLAGKRALSEDDAAEGNPVISDEVWDVVTEMVELTWRTFGIDLRGDLELMINLAKHVVPLAIRLRYGMKLKNPMLQEVRTGFPLAYQIAADASQILRNRYGARLTEDEIGYLALDFALSLERKRTERPLKNILFVSSTGAGSARLLEYRLRKEFSGVIGSIRFATAAHVAEEDFSQIDYVFSMVPILAELPVPVRIVGNPFEASGMDDLRAVLSKRAASSPVADVFDERLFFPHFKTDASLPDMPKRQVLDFLCERMAELHEVPESFTELVVEREMIVSTALGNRVAIMHPIETFGSTSFGALALLDDPVAWDVTGNMVQVAFLISFASSGSEKLNSLLGTMSELCTSLEMVDTLIESQTWETFAKLLSDAQERFETTVH